MKIYTIFSTVLNMSFTASFVIFAVILARLPLRKAPKIFSYLLWAVVLFRLLCPVSFSSSLSFLRMFDKAATETGSMEYIPSDIVYTDKKEPQISTGEAKERTSKEWDGEVLEARLVDKKAAIAAYLWVFGVAVMWIHSAISLSYLRKKLAKAEHRKANVYQMEQLVTPFVLGIFRPRIYIPATLDKRERRFILLHERTHIQRGDHLIKLFAFFALTIHWFNPLVWIAFQLAEKDMEMSCDEAVMKCMDRDIRAEYSESLLRLSIGKRTTLAMPLAFGESDIKARIKNVMRYHKPELMVGVAAMAVVAVLVAALGCNPHSTAAGTFSFAEKWAEAFCARDADAIVSMISEEMKDVLDENGILITGEDYFSFGWSSPWPWDTSYDDNMVPSYKILDETDSSAEILYYAWVSDPHVTVWREKLTYHIEGENRIVDTEELKFLDSISTMEEFKKAYFGGIEGTSMDYLSNGAGESLNHNALQDQENRFYADLFSPESAAAYLLNLSDEAGVVNVSSEKSEDGNTLVKIRFSSDETSVIYVTMVQPYGEGGIWVPQKIQIP